MLEGLDPFISYGLTDRGDVATYTKKLAADIVSLVDSTLAAPRTACTLDYGVLREDFSRNREGLPYDETDVPVLVARRTDGAPRAILFSYGAHPVAANSQLEFDPDYPAQAIKQIEAAWPGSSPQFLLGPAGDQNPSEQGGFALADDLGRRLGDTIGAGAASAGRSITLPVYTAFSSVPLPLDIDPAPDNIAAVRAEYVARSANPGAMGFVRRHAERMIDLIDGEPIEALETTIPLPIQRWRFSGPENLTILFSGGEVVSGFAVALRYEYEGSDRLWFLGYCNEVPAYIPSDELLDHACYA